MPRLDHPTNNHQWYIHQVRDNLSFYSRGASAARSRSSTPSEWSSGSSYPSNQDYYRGKTKSIYERDPLFSDFVSSIPTTSNMYNSGNLNCLKEQFQTMVQDKWSRKQMQDPSVCHDMALKVSKQCAGLNQIYLNFYRQVVGPTTSPELVSPPARLLEGSTLQPG